MRLFGPSGSFEKKNLFFLKFHPFDFNNENMRLLTLLHIQVLAKGFKFDFIDIVYYMLYEDYALCKGKSSN